MKAEEFLQNRKVQSRGKSKLIPAWPDIQKLRAADCSLYEIQTFLKENGIETSVPNLAAFIKRQEAKKQPDTNKPDAPTNQPGAVPQKSSDGIEADSSVTTDSSDGTEVDRLAVAIKDKGEKLDTFAPTGIPNIFKKGTTK